MSKNHQFAQDQISKVSQMLKAGQTTSVIGIPGSGISRFMKHLAEQPLGKMIYVDVFSFPSLTNEELFSNILEQLGGNAKDQTVTELVHDCSDRLKRLTKDGQRVVIVVSGFNKLSPNFNPDFFRYLRSLQSVKQDKIEFVFGICLRLETILPPDITSIDLRVFSNVYYLKSYNKEDLKYLLDTYGPKPEVDTKTFNQMIELSGGHFQFLQLLLQSEYLQTPTEDPFIKLSFENIWSHLSSPQKAILRKLATDGTYTKVDAYLTNVGIIQKSDDGYRLFSPLFADCVRAFSAPKLPIKERRLFAVLKRNEGRVVSKREIYDAVWRGQEIGSEWALNALVYRLRKHPAFTSQNYAIENQKKLGYILTKSI